MKTILALASIALVTSGLLAILVTGSWGPSVLIGIGVAAAFT